MDNGKKFINNVRFASSRYNAVLAVYRSFPGILDDVTNYRLVEPKEPCPYQFVLATR